MAIDGRKLKKKHIFTRRGSVAELIAALDQLAIVEQKHKGWARLIRLVALAVFLGFAVSAWRGSEASIFLAIFLPVGVLALASMIAPAPMTHDRVAFLRLVLKMLDQDAGKNGIFAVLLRLRSSYETISQGRNPHSPSGTQTLLQDAWFTLDGRLSDGTSISESCTDLTRRRTKRNARGRSKIKDRTICRLRVQLSYKPGRYGDAAAAAQTLAQPFRLPEGVQIKAFQSTDKSLAMKAVVKGNPTSDVLHAANEAMLLGAYRILNLARQRVVATRGAK